MGHSRRTVPAGRAAIQGIDQFIDGRILQGAVAEDHGLDPAAHGEVAFVHTQQQMCAVTGNVPRIVRGLIHLAGAGAPAAFGAAPRINIQNGTIVGVFENGFECFEETLDPIGFIWFLDVVQIALAGLLFLGSGHVPYCREACLCS